MHLDYDFKSWTRSLPGLIQQISSDTFCDGSFSNLSGSSYQLLLDNYSYSFFNCSITNMETYCWEVFLIGNLDVVLASLAEKLHWVNFQDVHSCFCLEVLVLVSLLSGEEVRGHPLGLCREGGGFHWLQQIFLPALEVTSSWTPSLLCFYLKWFWEENC